MKILICGDKHLKINRFEQSKELLKWIEKEIQDKKPELCVYLGDDMDTHAVLRSELMAEFSQHIDRITKIVPVVYVLGNHDYFKPKDSTYHSMQSLSGKNNLFIVDSVKEMYGMTFVPYMPNHADFPSTFNTDIVIAHQTFLGADYGHVRPDDGVDSTKYKDTLFISGHIHRRQEFANIIYPGTPYAMSIDDIDQEKGIMMFDSSTLEKIFIKSPFPVWKGIDFEISEVNNFDMLHSVLLSTLNKVDHWVIKVSGPKAELSAYFRSKKYLSLIKDKKVSVRMIPTDIIKHKVQIKSSNVSDIVSEYVNKVYKGSLDKSLIIEGAKSIVTSTLV